MAKPSPDLLTIDPAQRSLHAKTMAQTLGTGSCAMDAGCFHDLFDPLVSCDEIDLPLGFILPEQLLACTREIGP